ncbi:MAG: ABC transporter ATP-binding protein [Hyphomicrobiaceae bacterium]
MIKSIANEPTAATVRLHGLSKSFDGRTRAVDGIDLSIAAGEFFALLGPSGCGKTTTLRMIAGFEAPDDGRVFVGETDITDTPVHRRNMGMIFQSYALFPHRTVAENVAFGLRMRRLGAHEVRERVAGALKQVALEGYEDRRPAQLSGGQQQRVALARALVIRPPVLLCDEPLAALDRKLRQSMQLELKHLQKQLGVTLIFVTHDQEEAMAMSDRMAVMNAGRIDQIGTAAEIYRRPRTRFVADFIGEINLFDGEWHNGAFRDAGGCLLPADGQGRTGRSTIAVRPERMRFVKLGEAIFSGRIETANFLGGQILYRVAADGGRKLLVKEPSADGARFASDAAVGVTWNTQDAVILED